MPILETISSSSVRGFGFSQTVPTAAVNYGTSIIAFGTSATPFSNAYVWNNGLGTKVTNPTALTGVGGGAAFSPNGSHLVHGVDTSPYVAAYTWSTSGYGSQVTSPSTLPAGHTDTVSFSSSGAYVAFAMGNNSPYSIVYNWSASGFGTKITDPTPPSGLTYSNVVVFHPAGTYIAVGGDGSPYAHVYNWSSGWSTKVNNPSTLMTSEAIAINWSDGGTYIGIGRGVSGLAVYAWSSGWGAKANEPTTQATGSTYSVDFTSTANYVLQGIGSAPSVYAYPWTGSFGTKVGDPSGASGSTGARWSINNDYVVSGSTPSVWPWNGAFGTVQAAPSSPLNGSPVTNIAWKA